MKNSVVGPGPAGVAKAGLSGPITDWAGLRMQLLGELHKLCGGRPTEVKRSVLGRHFPSRFREIMLAAERDGFVELRRVQSGLVGSALAAVLGDDHYAHEAFVRFTPRGLQAYRYAIDHRQDVGQTPDSPETLVEDPNVPQPTAPLPGGSHRLRQASPSDPNDVPPKRALVGASVESGRAAPLHAEPALTERTPAMPSAAPAGATVQESVTAAVRIAAADAGEPAGSDGAGSSEPEPEPEPEPVALSAEHVRLWQELGAVGVGADQCAALQRLITELAGEPQREALPTPVLRWSLQTSRQPGVLRSSVDLALLVVRELGWR